MVRVLESYGLPVVHMVNLIPVAQSVGSNRMVETVSIPYPLGDPSLTDARQAALRRRLVEKALKSLEISIKSQTIF